jgi:hypothetical protein
MTADGSRLEPFSTVRTADTEKERAPDGREPFEVVQAKVTSERG